MKNGITVVLIKRHLHEGKNFAGAFTEIYEAARDAQLEIEVCREFDFSKENKNGITLAEEFYCIHKDKPHFQEIVDNMKGKCFAFFFKGRHKGIDPIKTARELLVGKEAFKERKGTDPADCDPGSLRKLFGRDIAYNGFHASDSLVNAYYEANLLFPGQVDATDLESLS